MVQGSLEFSMRVFKWYVDFKLATEASLFYYFKKSSFFLIATAIGKPLKIDDPTMALSRPSVARVCVELDLLKPLPSRVWIGTKSRKGYWQTVNYEDLPSYYLFCLLMGHSMQQYKRRNGPAITPTLAHNK